MHGIDDTIAAIATAPGAAGLAVIRVSGARALETADVVFRGRTPLTAAASHTLHHGWVGWPGRGDSAAGAGEGGQPIDEVVASVFRAPRSYTREDVVELSCHGGAGAARLLDALIAAGARLARPGEFTLRAFLHGRIDLAQAEAVADVIRAETDQARRIALAQLAGELSRRLAEVRAPIEDLLAEVEARVDFAEDVGGVEIPPRAVDAIGAASGALAELLGGSSFARAAREGLRVPIVGIPNAGKSSLFNALLGEERAIVAAEPGTTRDRVSEPVEIAGIRMVLSDTAGLRDESGEVEAIGVERARRLLEESPLVLWVVDGSREPTAAEQEIGARLAHGAVAAPGIAGASNGHAAPGAPVERAAPRTSNGHPPAASRRVVVALNKSDLDPHPAAEPLARAHGECVRVSARTGAGLTELRAALARLAGAGDAGLGAVSNARHIEALERSRAALDRAAAAARAGEPGEIVALELRECLAAIGEVTGQTVAEDLLDRIFARFCVGK